MDTITICQYIGNLLICFNGAINALIYSLLEKDFRLR